jgi:hypothetical protein
VPFPFGSGFLISMTAISPFTFPLKGNFYFKNAFSKKLFKIHEKLKKLCRRSEVNVPLQFVLENQEKIQ